MGFVRLRSRVAGWLLAILSIATACRPASAQQPAAPQKLIHVSVALGDVSLNKLIFAVAQDAGLYKKNGLDVDQYITPGAAEVVRKYKPQDFYDDSLLREIDRSGFIDKLYK